MTTCGVCGYDIIESILEWRTCTVQSILLLWGPILVFHKIRLPSNDNKAKFLQQHLFALFI